MARSNSWLLISGRIVRIHLRNAVRMQLCLRLINLAIYLATATTDTAIDVRVY